MFKELFLSTIISMSLSLNTSNDETKPHDYELMILAATDPDENFAYFIKRDWERELGEKYIDNIILLKLKLTQKCNKTYLKDAAIFPPSTVRTAPVVFFEVAR